MNGLGTRPHSSDELHLHSYDVYDIAYLAGGHVRVADTVVVALVERGHLRVGPDGRLSLVRLGRRHPVEAAALDAIGTRGWRSVDSVRWRFEADPRVTGIAERLARDGLVRWIALPVPARHRRIVRRTRAGHRLLRRVRLQPPAVAVPGGTSAPLVALDGPARMGDQRRRAEVFGPPCLPDPGADLRPGRRPSTPWSRAGLLGYGLVDDGFWYGGR